MNIDILNFSNITTKVNIAVSDAAALSVGPNGNTNPVLRVVSNVASQATGLLITGNAAGSGVALDVLSSGSNDNLLISPKGTGYTKLTSGMFGIGVTPTYGLHIAPTSGLTPGQTAFIQDATPSTGQTQVTIKVGATATSSIFRILNAAGTTALADIWTNGTQTYFNATVLQAGAAGGASGNSAAFINNVGAVVLRDIGYLGISSGTIASAVDVALARNAVGVFEINNGTAGTFRDLKLRRLDGSGGTAIATTDVALSGGWGASATVSAVSGDDTRGKITVQTNALDTPTLNPTCTLTFKDGTFTTAPFAVVSMNNASTGVMGAASCDTTATTLVVTYDGTPTALTAATYIFNYHVIK